jgi:hypothetical protein
MTGHKANAVRSQIDRALTLSALETCQRNRSNGKISAINLDTVHLASAIIGGDFVRAPALSTLQESRFLARKLVR